MSAAAKNPEEASQLRKRPLIVFKHRNLLEEQLNQVRSDNTETGKSAQDIPAGLHKQGRQILNTEIENPMRNRQAFISEINRILTAGAELQHLDEIKLIHRLNRWFQEAAHSQHDPKDSHGLPSLSFQQRLKGQIGYRRPL
jgi:hypothetical protein